MMQIILKKLEFDADTIAALTKEGITAEDFNKIFEEKYKAAEEARLADIKKGMTPTIREELKEELEKSLVAEKIKAFKKEIAKLVGITESGTKIAESSKEDFFEMLKTSVVPKTATDDKDKEISDLKKKLGEAYDDLEKEKVAKETLEKEIPLKYIDKQKYTSEKIEKAKLEKAASLKDLPISTEDFIAMLDGNLARGGITLDMDENGKIVPMKDGKQLQDDKYRAITFDAIVEERYEAIKPKSGGTPGGPAGGGAGGGGGEQPYVSEAQKRMQGEAV